MRSPFVCLGILLRLQHLFGPYLACRSTEPAFLDAEKVAIQVTDYLNQVVMNKTTSRLQMLEIKNVTWKVHLRVETATPRLHKQLHCSLG